MKEKSTVGKKRRENDCLNLNFGRGGRWAYAFWAFKGFTRIMCGPLGPSGIIRAPKLANLSVLLEHVSY